MNFPLYLIVLPREEKLLQIVVCFYPVGGRIGIDNTWPRYRGAIGFTEINNTVTAGTYYVYGNMELEDSDRMGIIKNEAFVLEVEDFGDNVIQRLQACNSWTYIYQRISLNVEQKTWRPWISFTVAQV